MQLTKIIQITSFQLNANVCI